VTYKKLSLLVLPLVATLSLQANDPFNDPFFQDPFGDNIFKEMMQMQQDMDKMFERMHNRMQQRSTRQISPLGTYKIKEQNQFVDKGDHYEFVSNIPESKENEIDIQTQNGMISITAKIIQKQENKISNAYSSSSSMKMYQQSMPLPSNADEQSVNMMYKDGKLIITVQKKKGTVIPSQPTKLETKQKEKKSQEVNSSIKKIKVPENSTMI